MIELVKSETFANLNFEFFKINEGHYSAESRMYIQHNYYRCYCKELDINAYSEEQNTEIALSNLWNTMTEMLVIHLMTVNRAEIEILKSAITESFKAGYNFSNFMDESVHIDTKKEAELMDFEISKLIEKYVK